MSHKTRALNTSDLVMSPFLTLLIFITTLCNRCFSFPLELDRYERPNAVRRNGTQRSSLKRAAIEPNCSRDQSEKINKTLRSLLQLAWAGIQASNETVSDFYERQQYDAIFHGQYQFGDSMEGVHRSFRAIYFEAMKTKYAGRLRVPNNQLRLSCVDPEGRCTGGRSAYSTAYPPPSTIVLVSLIHVC